MTIGSFGSVFAQTFVAMNLPENRRFADTNLLRYGALPQTSFMQSINLVTITLSKAMIGLHVCSIFLNGERQAASRSHVAYSESSCTGELKPH